MSFGLSAAAWIGIGTAAAGAGASLYGANKQAQAQKDTNAANRASVDKTNNLEWSNYLAQRGVIPNGPVATGQFPTSYTPTNTRLPLWANVNIPPPPNASLAAPQSSVPLFVKRGV